MSSVKNPPQTWTLENFPMIEVPDRPGVYWPDPEFIVTEDETPVDSIYSEKQQRLLTEPLHSSWRRSTENKEFVAMANVGLFRTPLNPLVPDTLLSLNVTLPEDVWTKGHRCYFIWLYGKPPEVVIEVVSNREGGEDEAKLLEYARMRVPYYVIHDPEQWLSSEILRIYRLDTSFVYQRIECAQFPEVGLGVTLWEGLYEDMRAVWLRWCDPSGQVIPTGAERAEAERLRSDDAVRETDVERRRAEQALREIEAERERAEQALRDVATEHERAEQALRAVATEHERAEQALRDVATEHERADKAAKRAARLAEKLRALGIDPNGDGA